MPRGYIGFTTKDRDKYCSAEMYRNHEVASDWVARCLAHLDLPASSISGKPIYPLNDQTGYQVIDV